MRFAGAGLALCLLSSTASAFCGFFVSGADQKLYNSASHVVLMRKGNRTVMTMSNSYKGPPQDFAMVVPVPVVLQKKQVRTLQPGVFHHIDELTAPRLVEYWEQDPCNPYSNRHKKMSKPMDSMDDGGGGGRGSASSENEYKVRIEAKFSSGEYDILILSAEDSGGLERWLKDNHYKIPEGAAEALAPYVRDQMKFFVAKVNLNKVKFDAQGQAMLSPLQFNYAANELRLPVRLGLLNAEEKQDLLVYIIHPKKRFEVANYPNVFITTNLDVTNSVKKTFGQFYAELFDETVRRNNNKAVVTEYSWDTASCDPCPGPPLEDNDLATLGSKHLGGTDEGSWVVTRLHTRYDKQTLSEDLVFRMARAVKGGRADREDGGGGHGATRDEENNFQARYIIRHYWPKKIACDNPQRNIWGGPPGSSSRHPPSSPARDLASAQRGAVKLVEVVKTPVPSLGLPGTGRKSK